MEDPSSKPYVKEMVEFAVSEYNKFAKTSLKFEKVISGEQQLVTGANYKLVISASSGSGSGSGLSKRYEAVVYSVSWKNYMELKSFKPI